MATLQAGQTVSIQLAEGESYTVTPSGTAQVSTRGVSGSELSAPRTLTSAQTFGPYAESGVINIACLVGTAIYAQAGGAVYQDPTTRALVGADGVSPGNGTPIAAADLAGSSGVLGGMYELVDGPDAGAKLTWAIPAGESSPTWCWWLWPQSAYTA